MPLSLKTPATALAAGLIAFAVAAAVLLIIRGDGPHLPDRAAQQRALPSQPRPDATTDQRIAAYQAIVRARPNVAAGYTLLASNELQKVRETGDAGYYARAAATIDRGLTVAPGDLGLLTERGSLALSRHDFRAGLRDGERAHRADPTLNRPFGVIVDALVELGRYDQAGRVLQEMIDHKPDLAAYARVSYFRELHGDIEGARSALGLAVSAGGAAAENVAYVQTLLGNLEFADGRLPAAQRAFDEALFRFPDYAPALAGTARVDAARGRDAKAIRTLRAVVARLPLPEYVILLGDTELAAGRVSAARSDYALVGAEQRLLAASGVNTDVELALFEADHGSPARGVRLARRAWQRAPSVRSADALGWTLTRAGRPEQALPWARQALRLGSRDAQVVYHAGMTARAAGQPALARKWLRAALSRNPQFSPLYGPRAERALERLS